MVDRGVKNNLQLSNSSSLFLFFFFSLLLSSNDLLILLLSLFESLLELVGV